MISIIIPTYNRPQLLKERALKSALAQTYKDIEIIVVDDGSTEPYDVKGVRYFKPWEKNRGGSAARNYGVSQAKGNYIVFIDDDNELDPTFIEKTLPVFKENMWVSAVTTGRYIKSELSGESKAMPTINKFPGIDWGWLIDRAVFNEVQYDETIWGDEDADFGIQFCKHFTYTVVPEYLQTAYAPNAEDEVSSNTFPNKRRLLGLKNFLNKNLKEYKDPNERRYILRLAGRNYLRARKYFEADLFFIKSFMAVPNWRTFKHLFFALFGWNVYNWYMTREENK